MISFRHLPIGSAIGSGDLVFRHFGTEPLYIPFTPNDENKFPTQLVGFYAEPLTGLASGASTSYVGSVFCKPWLTKNAKKLGRAYSSIGNFASSFADYRLGDIAIGYSSDSAASGTKALNVWLFDYKPTAAEANDYINEQNSTILYELFEPDDSVWNAVERIADGVYGYYNESNRVFVPVKDMDAMPSNSFMGGNPFAGGETGK